MASKIDVEEFRKAVVAYKIAAEQFIWAAYENPDYELAGDGFKSPLYGAFRSAQSALVVACHRLPAAAFLLHVIEDGQKPILRLHMKAVRTLNGDESADESNSLDDIIETLKHVQRLELFGGLWTPIETRQFSRWYWTTDILKRAGRDGVPMPDRTWQKHRKRLGNQIENHPQSGAQKVHVTRHANDDLGLNLPDFAETQPP